MLQFIIEYFHEILFYSLFTMAVFFSWNVIMTKTTLRATLSLCFLILTNACFFLLLNAEFMAIIQILVYISGIVILLIFVIMLTDVTQEYIPGTLFQSFLAKINVALFFSAIVCLVIFYFPSHMLMKNFITYHENNLALIGFSILNTNQNGYILPFEIISLLLLVVLVGCLKISIK